MTYPTNYTPVNKHDLISESRVSVSRMEPSLSPKELIQEATNSMDSHQTKSYPKRISTIYTYKDAPAHPRPMSARLPIQGFCSLPSIGLASSSFLEPTLEGMITCTIAVKRADGDYKHKLRLKPKDIQNSNNFSILCQQLRKNAKCAFFICSKTKRGGFVVAMDDTRDGCDYAAYCLVASVDDLRRILMQSESSSTSRGMEIDENETATDADAGMWKPPGTENGTQEVGSADMWQPSTPPPEDGTTTASSADMWQPSTPPPEDGTTTASSADMWQPSTPPPEDGTTTASSADMWQPSTPPPEDGTTADDSNNMWQPSTPPPENGTTADDSNNMWQPSTPPDDGNQAFGSAEMWQPSTPPEQNIFFTSDATATNMEVDSNPKDPDNDNEVENNGSTFHTDSGAAAADKFYSNLTRSLGTRADSMLYHMRNFNGWIKATQIAELDPLTIDSSSANSKKRKRTKHPLRVLDLACGKGGDLGKWILHNRRIGNYVGIDVARGSLGDAALRARKMRQLNKCVFTCADLGADVPGRLKSSKHTKMQKLLSWSLKDDDGYGDPKFELLRGGGISESDRFDVVSIQFAIHYMMSSLKRARRFFHTVSQLLEIGGNLIATTIDSRVVMQHMMNTGYNFHFDDDEDQKNDCSKSEGLIVAVGNGACQLKFDRDTVKKIFKNDGGSSGSALNPDHFGLEYTFTLVEGQDHAAGVGQAVDLPEWLTPLPVLVELAKEAGMKLDYASNFHEFFKHRKDPMSNHASHGALYNMSVLNRSGTISEQEWDISRMYMAVQFIKERESTLHIDDDEDISDEESEDEGADADVDASPKKLQIDMDDPKVKSMYVVAMMKAKKASGEQWQGMSGDERNAKTNEFLAELMAK